MDGRFRGNDHAGRYMGKSSAVDPVVDDYSGSRGKDVGKTMHSSLQWGRNFKAGSAVLQERQDLLCAEVCWGKGLSPGTHGGGIEGRHRRRVFANQGSRSRGVRFPGVGFSMEA